MKGEIKKKYQEFLNHIDFPAIIYIYENNRVLAVNNYAKGIIGSLGEDIRELFEGKKLKFPKNILRGGSTLVPNVSIITKEKGKMNIDMDVNIFKVDHVHFVFLLFEDTFKNNFVGYLSVQTPRVVWQYQGDENIGMNSGLRKDVELLTQVSNHLEAVKVLDEILYGKIKDIGKRIMETGESQYNSIQMITTQEKDNIFIKVHRMPIICSSGESMGIISVHNKILDKEKHRELFDSAIKSNTLVNEKIDKGDTVFISWMPGEKASIQYISPNIARYGYSTEDFCSGKITLQDIIHPDDYSIMQCKFEMNQEIQSEEAKTAVYEYRIKKTNGEDVWVHEECSPVILNDSVAYNFSSLQDITSRKILENELNERKREYQLKKEHLLNSDDVGYDIFKLEDLFDLEEIEVVQRALSGIMNLVSFVTDENGQWIKEPVSSILLDEEMLHIFKSKKSTKMYKEIGHKAFRNEEVCIDTFFHEAIKISAIPFSIRGVHLGNLIVVSTIDKISINLSEKNHEKYKKFEKIFDRNHNKGIQEFESMVRFFWEHIQCICRAEYHNIERKKEEDKARKSSTDLKETYQNMEQILNNIDCCIFAMNIQDYHIKFANDKMKKVYGDDVEDNDLFAFLIGYSIEIRNDDSSYEDINKILKELDGNNKKGLKAKFYDNMNDQFIVAVLEKIVWFDGMEVILVTMNDILGADEKKEEKRSVYTDYLTGLPNRMKFEMDAKTSIMRAIEKNKNGAVIMFDLNDFKNINYKLGHEYGEHFIKEVAKKLQKNKQIKEGIYRCRGVEFLLLIECELEEEIDEIANEVVKYFESPWMVKGEEILCSISMGVTLFPRDGINPKELLKNADLAIFEGKNMGENAKVYYKTENYTIRMR